jgi:hypothetical protein
VQVRRYHLPQSLAGPFTAGDVSEALFRPRRSSGTDCNLTIGTNDYPIGRADLVYRQFKVIIEYEGDQHRTDKWQWNFDIGRQGPAPTFQHRMECSLRGHCAVFRLLS